MAYSLYTEAFGPAYANRQVLLKESTTGRPATILSGLNGGGLSSDGLATLNARGELQVTVNTSLDYVIQFIGEDTVTPDVFDNPANHVSVEQGMGSGTWLREYLDKVAALDSQRTSTYKAHQERFVENVKPEMEVVADSEQAYKTAEQLAEDGRWIGGAKNLAKLVTGRGRLKAKAKPPVK